MGTDMKCGCRTSGDAWYLCDEHEAEMLCKVEVLEEDHNSSNPQEDLENEE